MWPCCWNISNSSMTPQEVAKWVKSFKNANKQGTCFVELNWWPRSCVASPRCEGQWGPVLLHCCSCCVLRVLRLLSSKPNWGRFRHKLLSCALYTIQLSIRLIFVLTNANTNTNTNANTIANTIANTNTNTDLCNYKLLSFSYICSDKCMKTSVSWVGSSARQNSGGNDEKEKFNWSAGQSLLCNYLSKLTTLNPIFQLPHI